MDKRYSVYERGTDRPIIINGTGPQCAAALGLKINAFWQTASMQRRGLRLGKFEIFDDEEDDDEVDSFGAAPY